MRKECKNRALINSFYLFYSYGNIVPDSLHLNHSIKLIDTHTDDTYYLYEAIKLSQNLMNNYIFSKEISDIIINIYVNLTVDIHIELDAADNDSNNSIVFDSDDDMVDSDDDDDDSIYYNQNIILTV